MYVKITAKSKDCGKLFGILPTKLALASRHVVKNVFYHICGGTKEDYFFACIWVYLVSKELSLG